MLKPKVRTGLVSTALTFVAGIWVFLAPFVVDYQNDWKNLTDATKNDFASGTTLLALSAVTFFAVTALAVREAVRWADKRRAREAAGAPAGQATGPIGGVAKYFVGAAGSLLTGLVGAWLMVAPFALAYQAEDADWADPTVADFWTGAVVIVISLVGLVAYSSGLFDELRERGALVVPERRDTTATVSPTDNPAGRELEQVLQPLVAAMMRDAEERRERGPDEK